MEIDKEIYRHRSIIFGLHPAVYFYALNGRHQPTAVLAVASLLMELESKNEFIKFTEVRERFENFLIVHKVFVNQLTVRHGSMAKGYRPLKDYYRFVLDQVIAGHSETEIEGILDQHEKYHKLVKERPMLTKKAKPFSGAAKQVTIVAGVLDQAKLCELCHARIDFKAIHVDHIKDRIKGGLATTENARLIHPYCDSTYKRYLENAKAAV